MDKTFLIVTSIADHYNPILNRLASESSARNIPFIVIGDVKSPDTFNLNGCDYYSIDRQKTLDFLLAESLPFKHYARKNIGYLLAMSHGAEIIIETDDDNIPLEGFWDDRSREVTGHLLVNKKWINVYKHFTKSHIWPRGFALEHLQDKLPDLDDLMILNCPIQQGLADENPDVDAIYRLILPLPVYFRSESGLALADISICPFNSQNTTWFREAFPLLYLPSYCSFRMTDIWRSFVAQRIAWTCGWSVFFHKSTVIQERNDHNLLKDFQDEIPGYLNNVKIMDNLIELSLKEGIDYIPENLILCYNKLIDLGLFSVDELELLNCWLSDLKQLKIL